MTGRRPTSGPVTIDPGFVATADGSALISQGGTRVICTASVNDSVPRWMQGRGRGWVTAEYAMLPASTGERKSRDVSRGKQDGRGVEIQRLIGRSLRVVVDFEALGERSVYVDCDVLEADGGTRCAAITGGYVALRLAFQKLLDKKLIETMPLNGSVAAVSVGMVDGRALCDLDYAEDSSAEVDANVVMTGDGGLVEVQATAERTPLSRASLDELLGARRDGNLAAAPGSGAGCWVDPRHRQQAQAARDERTAAGGRAGAAAGGGRAAPRGRRPTTPRSRSRRHGRRIVATGKAAVADDSGIGAVALDGRPGIQSARYGGPKVPPTRRTSTSSCARSPRARGSREAYYVCALALVEEDGAEHVFEARCEGRLIGEPRGEGGFGYDPAFVPDATGPGDERTMSELSQAEKNEISHRGAAARMLAEHLGTTARPRP